MKPRPVPAGYDPLADVLDAALEQAARGKGMDRHASPGQSFMEQPMMQIIALAGIGFPMGQVMKKSQETLRLVERGEAGRARAEILGAIVYLAGAALALADGTEPNTGRGDPPDGYGCAEGRRSPCARCPSAPPPKPDR